MVDNKPPKFLITCDQADVLRKHDFLKKRIKVYE